MPTEIISTGPTDAPVPRHSGWLDQERECLGRDTVLLVDDDRGVRRLVERVLRTSGYTVLSASSAVAALLIEKHYRGPIDLLLTDVLMPEATGHELAGDFLQVRPSVKILYMSGAYDTAIIRDGSVIMAGPFVPKPLSQRTLLRAVKDALGRN